MKIDFSKVNAGGNDFILINNLDGRFDTFIADKNFPLFLQKVCRRGLGVGADGVIFASKARENSEEEVNARYFEPDGTESPFCGNGSACFVSWLVLKNIMKNHTFFVGSNFGIFRGRIKEYNRCGICLPNPLNYRKDICIAVDKNLLYTDFIETGTGHAIVYVENVDSIDVENIGKKIRYNPIYGERTNANFVEQISEGKIKVRTYEFGVEAETLACGTGCASAAMLIAVRNNWDEKYLRGKEPVLVDVRGGTTLKIWFLYHKAEKEFTDLCLDVEISLVYDGTISEDFMEKLK